MSDWIEWKGGACPVSEDTEVEVEFDSMARWIGTASDFPWAHLDGEGNLVAYRVVNSAHNDNVKQERAAG